MARPEPSRRTVVAALGIAQILGWGSSFYFPAVLAAPIAAETGWSLGWVVGGVTVGMLVSGLISPWVGRLIQHWGGRPVLALSSLLFAAGLAGIGLAPALPVYLLAWLVVGAGMGAGLYDAAFAALGRLYGQAARGPIASLTLFGGFSSTVCWPLSALLLETFGWRGTCLVYAALHLAVALPLQLVMPARAADGAASTRAGEPGARGAALAKDENLVFILVAAVLSLAAAIGAIVIVHLLIFLQARGIGAALAVTLGTLFGPAQVAARAIERLFGTYYHPIWTMAAAGVLMTAGLALFGFGTAALGPAIVIYAAGYGVSWIARGTLPLALFGAARYPLLMGRLALPSLIAQALAPAAGALMVEHHGADATIAVLTACAALNVGLIAILVRLYLRRQ
jgi:MFS family permease